MSRLASIALGSCPHDLNAVSVSVNGPGAPVVHEERHHVTAIHSSSHHQTAALELLEKEAHDLRKGKQLGAKGTGATRLPAKSAAINPTLVIQHDTPPVPGDWSPDTTLGRGLSKESIFLPFAHLGVGNGLKDIVPREHQRLVHTSEPLRTLHLSRPRRPRYSSRKALGRFEGRGAWAAARPLPGSSQKASEAPEHLCQAIRKRLEVRPKRPRRLRNPAGSKASHRYFEAAKWLG